MSSILPGMTGDFAKGVSGSGPVYDTSPAGLGLSPAYLASASASASSSNTTSGTIFPTSPANGDVFIYTADATNGVKWQFQYDSSQTTYKWVAVGPTPWSASVDTGETTSSTSYAALTTPGPSIILPLAGDYYVLLGAYLDPAVGSVARMSYDIGGAGAIDGDSIADVSGPSGQPGTGHRHRMRRKAGLTAVTLTAKYKSVGGGTTLFQDRFIAVIPIRVSG